MNKAKALLAGLLAGLTTSPAHSEEAATAPLRPAAGFQIMTEQEVQRHRERMAELSGAAREAYRDAQYETLKTRAQQHGYHLPRRAPWHQDGPPSEPRSGILLAADPGDESGPATVMPNPGEAYRETMKHRFERYLKEREQHRTQAEQRRAQLRSDQQARVEQHQAEIKERRAEHKQELEQRAAQSQIRLDQRQAELRKLRAEAGAPLPRDAQGPGPSSPAENDMARNRPVSRQLAELRAANAAEREELRAQNDRGLEQKRAELEALRQTRADLPGGAPTAAPPAEESATVPAEPPSGDPAADIPPRDRIDQRRAQVEAQRQALKAPPASGSNTGEAPSERPVDETGPSSAGQAARKPTGRSSAPAAGYYPYPAYPRHPAAPYPPRPYYPNPYWAPPR